MNGRIALLVVLAAAAFFLFGCMSPQYQFCCYKDEALPTDPADAVCKGMNETNEEQILPVVKCDADNWTCTLEDTYSNGTHKTAPICPNVKAVPCNTSCSGIFCGTFFYDPRPLAAGYGQDESHTKKQKKGGGEAALDKPLGLWQAQCTLQNMSPIFLRQLENSGDIVMNKFRFGVGSSFQDFEEAQYYFPITDQACYLNPSGTVDRYILYAIPNQVQGGGQLCTKVSSTYVCSTDGDIRSYSYFDCASRCALKNYGYKPEIEPFNPYLTKYEDNWIGNPFAYGPYTGALTTPYPSGISGSAIDFYDRYRNSVGSLPSGNDVDKYGYGTTLYGATFGKTHLNTEGGNDGYSLLRYLAYEGKPPGDDSVPAIPVFGLITSPPSEVDITPFYFDWNWEGQHDSETVFLTMENDPHQFYPWLLAHHSVYNKQLSEGHLLANGSVAGGAEFECSNAQDCLSGYCNNFDTKRGVCVGVDGQDIICDCSDDASGKALCIGSKGVSVPSWDDPGTDVEVPVTLSAPIDIGGSTHAGQDETIAQLPAMGAIKMIALNHNPTDEDNPQYIDTPFFVMHIGGGKYDTADKAKLPDYTVRTWASVNPAEKDKIYNTVYMMSYLLDPCGAVPDGWMGSWHFSRGDKKYIVCCDGGTNCGKSDENTTVIGDFGSAGKSATRFIQNCMSGSDENGHKYFDDIYLCYGNNAKDQMDSTDGFALGGKEQSELVSSTIVAANSGKGFCTLLSEDSNIDLGEAEDAQSLSCYIYKSGGHTRQGSENMDKDCAAETDSMIVIAPTWHKDIGRWSIGKCLLNENGDDLEIKDYGVCESCGYLGMAKQEITALPMESNTNLDPSASDTMYGNTYCPNMVIHTPQNYYSLFQKSISHGAPFGDYSLEPYGMNGYNSYEVGSYYWDDDPNVEGCTYPNSYNLFTDISGADPPYGQKGLPYTYPNAFYIDTQLESLMKRNVQPVIFATDGNLWAEGSDSTTTDPDNPYQTYSVVFDTNEYPHTKTPNQHYSTFELIKELYQNRGYLFAAIPTKDATSSSTYCDNESGKGDGCVYYSIGSFLGNTITNEGAAILVMQKSPPLFIKCKDGQPCKPGEMPELLPGGLPIGYCSDYGCYSNSNVGFYSSIDDRAKATRLQCPNCMTSVAIGYGPFEDSPEGNFDMKQRMRELSLVFEYIANPGMKDVLSPTGLPIGKEATGTPIDDFDVTYKCDNLYDCHYDDINCIEGAPKDYVCNKLRLADIDVISMNIQLRDGDDYCKIKDEDARFSAILSNMTEFGRVVLQRFGKPIVVTDFTINRTGDCWDHENGGRFMTYMGNHAKDLVQSGYIGLIYGKWDDTIGEYNGIRNDISKGGETYAAGYRDEFFGGVFTAARKFAGHSIMTYYIEVPEKDTCDCVPCSAIDKPEFCNGRYKGRSTQTCDGYTPGASMKWPDNCIRKDLCQEPSPSAYENGIICDVVYDNGTNDTLIYKVGDVAGSPQGYRDVISSLDDFTWCFDLLENNTVTYEKSEQHSYDSLPAVFPMDGNTSVECNPASGLMDSFCGYNPPIDKYQMSCRFSSAVFEDFAPPGTVGPVRYVGSG